MRNLSLPVRISAASAKFQQEMDQPEFLHFDVTGKIIGAVHRVYEELGSGFPRDFYQNALTRALVQNNSDFSAGHPIAVSYDNAVVGEWRANLLVETKNGYL
jgi:hypothetical protein